MLKVQYQNGKLEDFPEDLATFAAKVVERLDQERMCFYLEDAIVATRPFGPDYLRIAAMDILACEVAVRGVSAASAKKMLTLAIVEDSTYDGVEEFFNDFDVRFVP